MMANQPGKFFATTLTKRELLTSDVTCPAGVPVRLSEFEVPLGKFYAWGRGENLGLKATEGRIYVALRNPSSELLNGKIRLIAINQLGQEAHVYWEGRTEHCSLGFSSLEDRVILPAMEPVIPQGFKLAVVFIADSDCTVSASYSGMLIDARVARAITV